MSILFQNISKSYGNQQVLNSLSFSVKSGEIVGFLGPNGAGKSTTMKLLTGILPYENGSIQVGGYEVRTHPMEVKQMVGYLPEQNPLYPDMYVREYLAFMADIHQLGKAKNKRIEALIEELGLESEAHKKIATLSKGYRQRVGLAQALIHEPEVLILDEPTTGLDPNQLVGIRDLIHEIGKERTVLFSTHILQEIEAVCNRVLIINKGEIVADYSDFNQADLFEEKLFRIELEFLNTVDKIAMDSLISQETKDGKSFLIESKEDVRAALFDFAVNNGNKILTMKMVQRDMEAIFRELTAP